MRGFDAPQGGCSGFSPPQGGAVDAPVEFPSLTNAYVRFKGELVQLTGSSPPIDDGETIVTWTEPENSIAPTQGTDSLRPTAVLAGPYLNFGGGSHVLGTTGTPYVHPGGDFTITTYARCTSETTFRGICEINDLVAIWRDPGGEPVFTRVGATDHKFAAGLWPLNEWIALTFVYDASALEVTLWINGVLIATLTGLPLIPGATKDIYVGSYDKFEVYWDKGGGTMQIERLRLWGINTPDKHPDGRDRADMATAVAEGIAPLQSIVAIQTVKDKRGGRGRLLAVVHGQDGCVNQVLIEEGLAKSYHGRGQMERFPAGEVFPVPVELRSVWTPPGVPTELLRVMGEI